MWVKVQDINLHSPPMLPCTWYQPCTTCSTWSMVSSWLVGCLPAWLVSSWPVGCLPAWRKVISSSESLAMILTSCDPPCMEPCTSWALHQWMGGSQPPKPIFFKFKTCFLKNYKLFGKKTNYLPDLVLLTKNHNLFKNGQIYFEIIKSKFREIPRDLKNPWEFGVRSWFYLVFLLVCNKFPRGPNSGKLPRDLNKS